MRIKKGFVIRELVGEKIVSGEGIEQIDFNKIVTLNSSAAYLWENICDIDFTSETMADLLVEKYNVEYDIALQDSLSLLESWNSIGLLDKQ